jgi:hypothetical protein
MAGQAVPVVVIPRYTSYVGANTFTTVPLDVSADVTAFLTFWRGPCPAGFAAVFELSHDALVWSNALGTTIVLDNRSDKLEIPLTRRWFRVRISLSTWPITCWATGLLERRLEQK